MENLAERLRKQTRPDVDGLVREALQTVLAERRGVNREKAHASLEHLDSLEMVELVMALEEEVDKRSGD